MANDQPTGEDAVRLRRATQQHILENPGQRQPHRGGEAGGIDNDTGWNLADDGNPHRFTTDPREIRRMAIELNTEYWRHGSSGVQEKLQSYAVREDYKQQREQKKKQETIIKDTIVNAKEQQELAAMAATQVSASLQSGQTPKPDDVMMMINPGPEPIETPPVEIEITLPEDYQGICFERSWWRRATFTNVTRPEADYVIPDGIENDILKDLHVMLVQNPSGTYYIIRGLNKDMGMLFYTVLPDNTYAVTFEDRIEGKHDEPPTGFK